MKIFKATLQLTSFLKLVFSSLDLETIFTSIMEQSDHFVNLVFRVYLLVA